MTTKKKQLSEFVLTKKALKNMYVQLECWRKNAPRTYLIPGKDGQRIFTTPAKLAQAHIKSKPIKVYYINIRGKKTLLKDTLPVHEFIAYMFLTSDPDCYPFNKNPIDGVSI